MRIAKDWWNDVLEAGMLLLAAGCLIYFLVVGSWPKVLECILIITVLVGIRLLLKLKKTSLFPVLRTSILLFICLTMFVANIFGMYGVIPHLDDIEHVASGVILGFVGLLVFRQISKNTNLETFRSSMIPVWFCWFFAVAMAGCWEMYEFTTDQLLGFHSQGGGLVDTMGDIINGSLGGTVTIMYLASLAKKGKLPL
ncbi:hypothetical protein [Paenibacillus sp. HJGM_3]|uniref:hypothetical protein n=1 Tax=Paenibacillus sp. HJGM_3 TaxID=3379816 RepID=UPI00385E8FF2